MFFLLFRNIIISLTLLLHFALFTGVSALDLLYMYLHGFTHRQFSAGVKEAKVSFYLLRRKILFIYVLHVAVSNVT